MSRLALSVVLAIALLAVARAQAPLAPAPLPLVQEADLTYVGAVRLPDDPGAQPNFDYGGAPIAFDDADGGLYVGANSGPGGPRPAAKLKLPEFGTGDVLTLPKATFLEPFVPDISNGEAANLNGQGDAGRLSGLGITPDGRLLTNWAIDYDANNTTRRATMLRSRTLADATGSTPMVAIYDQGMQGHTAGECIAQIPADYQARLRGTMITGSFGRSIISRGSAGPAAFAFDHKQIDGKRRTVPGKALIDYPAEAQRLGAWDRDPTPMYGSTDQAGGCVIVPGTRSLLFFGRHGYGKFCYGPGTTDKSLHGKPSGEGDPWCYDPTTSTKGQHGYPYRFFVWAYDLDQVARVAAGRMSPWDIKPYAVWPFDLPLGKPNQLPQINGVAHDRAKRRIFLAAREGNPVTFASVIHALQLPDFVQR